MMTIQQEPWSQVAPEFDALGVLNYVEADISGGREAYSLDHDTLRDLDEGGMVHITTARDGAKLVGYALSVLAPRHMQYNKPVAQYLGVYLLPEYRKGMAGMKLMQSDEASLNNRGITIMYGGYASGYDLKVLFDRLGWEMAESTYSKWV